MRADRALLLWLVASALASTACLRRASFHCEAAAQCALGGAAGRCEPDGACSVADGSCPDGFRYADGAPLAGTCVVSADAAMADVRLADGPGPRAVNVCLVQAAFTPAAGSCGRQVCDQDARCCDRAWSDRCVQLAETVCHAACSGVVATIGPGMVKVQRWVVNTYVPVWSQPIGSGLGNAAVAWADFDGDGDADLAYCEGQASVHVMQNGGSCGAPFCQVAEAGPVPDCISLHWVDLDGDGDLDLAGAGASEGFAWLVDDGLWPTTVVAALGQRYTFDLAWADIDGDGDQDFAQAGYENPATVETLSSTGPQTSPTLTTVWSDEPPHGSDRHQGVAWGDVDGDGTLDLLCAGERFLRVYTGTSTTTFTPATALYLDASGGADVNDVAFVDADQDGDLDIAAVADGDPPFVLRNNVFGSGSHGYATTAVWTGGVVMRGSRIAVGDVNGDGLEDLFVGARPDASLPAATGLFLKRGATAAWGDAANLPQWTDPSAQVIYNVALAPDWQ